MSEQKLDLILTELQKVNERVTKIEFEQQRHNKHIQQLIQIVGMTNHNLIEFQNETTRRFEWMDRHMRLLESDFDLILQNSNEHKRDINRLKHVQ